MKFPSRNPIVCNRGHAPCTVMYRDLVGHHTCGARRWSAARSCCRSRRCSRAAAAGARRPSMAVAARARVSGARVCEGRVVRACIDGHVAERIEDCASDGVCSLDRCTSPACASVESAKNGFAGCVFYTVEVGQRRERRPRGDQLPRHQSRRRNRGREAGAVGGNDVELSRDGDDRRRRGGAVADRRSPDRQERWSAEGWPSPDGHPARDSGADPERRRQPRTRPARAGRCCCRFRCSVVATW